MAALAFFGTFALELTNIAFSFLKTLNVFWIFLRFFLSLGN